MRPRERRLTCLPGDTSVSEARLAPAGWRGQMGSAASRTASRPVFWWLVLASVLAVCMPAHAADDANQPVSAELRADMARARDRQYIDTPVAYRAEVARAERLGRRLHAALTNDAVAAPADPAPLARAQSWSLPKCAGASYRPVLVNDMAEGAASATQRFVYLIAVAEARDRAVVGVHYRLSLAADGGGFAAVEPSSSACMTAPVRIDEGSAFVLTYTRGCTPSEFHVLLSLQQGQPLVVLTSVGLWRLEQGQIHLASPSARICLDRKIGTALNRWVVLGDRRPSSKGELMVAAPYMDWQAGLSADVVGQVRQDEHGQFQWTQRDPSHVRFKVRLSDGGRVAQGMVAILPLEALSALGLDDPSSQLAPYARGGDASDTAIQLASYLNHGGDSESALVHLAAVPAKTPEQALRHAFETGYAFNALRRHDEAAKVLGPVELAHPEDVDICREMAYAYAMRGDRVEAVARYERCLSVIPDRPGFFRAEMTGMLVTLTRLLGQTETCRLWLDRLKVEVARAPEESAAGARTLQALRELSCTP